MANTNNRPLILGHRGASFGRVDNSLDAFANVKVLGGDGAELDVRATSDGVLAVMHDPVIKNFGAVAEHTFKSLSSATGPSLVRLEEALEVLDGQVVDIEIKSDPKEIGWVPSELTSRLLARILKDYVGSASVFVTSFSERALEIFSGLAPEIALGLLGTIGSDMASRCHVAVSLGANYVVPHHSGISAQGVREAHELGLGVVAWTVDTAERVVELADFGVDVVITNRIDLACSALGARL